MTKTLEPIRGCVLALTSITGDEKTVVGEGIDILDPDIEVVNAARVSYLKRRKHMDDNERKLINYLAKHKHMSPFRHVHIGFRVRCPEFVARQWYKHVIGAEYTFKDHAWNEVSQRYVRVDDLGHYIPENFRAQSKTNKQCSEGLIENQERARQIYDDVIEYTRNAYAELLELGDSREQARAVLTFATNTEFRWTASLEACMNFIKLRDHDGSQHEIRRFAQAMGLILSAHIPTSYRALREHL